MASSRTLVGVQTSVSFHRMRRLPPPGSHEVIVTAFWSQFHRTRELEHAARAVRTLWKSPYRRHGTVLALQATSARFGFHLLGVVKVRGLCDPSVEFRHAVRRKLVPGYFIRGVEQTDPVGAVCTVASQPTLRLMDDLKAILSP
jgi:hypothetical protein